MLLQLPIFQKCSYTISFKAFVLPLSVILPKMDFYHPGNIAVFIRQTTFLRLQMENLIISHPVTKKLLESYQ